MLFDYSCFRVYYWSLKLHGIVSAPWGSVFKMATPYICYTFVNTYLFANVDLIKMSMCNTSSWGQRLQTNMRWCKCSWKGNKRICGVQRHFYSNKSLWIIFCSIPPNLMLKNIIGESSAGSTAAFMKLSSILCLHLRERDASLGDLYMNLAITAWPLEIPKQDCTIVPGFVI